MTDQERIIDRIQKLYAKAESTANLGNEAEAMVFIKKVDEMLAKHKLEKSVLTFNQREEADPLGKTYAHGKGKKRRVAWIEDLSIYVSGAYHCKIIVITGSDSFFIIGRKTDREIAGYVITKLVNFLSEECKRQHSAMRYKLYHENDGDMTGAHGFKASFFRAAVQRIRQRLDELKQEHVHDTKQYAIMVTQSEVEVKDWLKSNMETQSVNVVRGSKGGNAAGYAAGVSAGNRADISGRGVHAGGSGPKRLGK